MGWEIIYGQKKGKKLAIDRVFDNRAEAIATVRKIRKGYGLCLPLTTRKKRKRKK